MLYAALVLVFLAIIATAAAVATDDPSLGSIAAALALIAAWVWVLQAGR